LVTIDPPTINGDIGSLAIRRSGSPRGSGSPIARDCPCPLTPLPLPRPPVQDNGGNDLGHLISRSLSLSLSLSLASPPPPIPRPAADCEGGDSLAGRGRARSNDSNIVALRFCVHHSLIIVRFRRVNNGLGQTSLNGFHPPLRRTVAGCIVSTLARLYVARIAPNFAIAYKKEIYYLLPWLVADLRRLELKLSIPLRGTRSAGKAIGTRGGSIRCVIGAESARRALRKSRGGSRAFAL